MYTQAMVPTIRCPSSLCGEKILGSFHTKGEHMFLSRANRSHSPPAFALAARTHPVAKAPPTAMVKAKNGNQRGYFASIAERWILYGRRLPACRAGLPALPLG